MSAPNPFAFPVTPEIWATNLDFCGMTLRDWFAGQAMQGIVGSIDGEDNYQRLRDLANREDISVSQWIARDAFKQADAMLDARVAESAADVTPAPPAKPLGDEWKCEHGFNDMFDCEICRPF